MERLHTLLDRFVDARPEERAEIEAEVWSTFGEDRAVLALDMSGFSLGVRRSGIVAYMGQIRRMVRIARPIVHGFRGCIVKAEADNLLALFEHAADAFRAALAINLALIDERTRHPSPLPFAGSIGIDLGRVLHVPGRDAFGDAVNVAYKLGEDIARPDEILLTPAVYELLSPAEQGRLEAGEFSVSGLALAVWRTVASA